MKTFRCPKCKKHYRLNPFGTEYEPRKFNLVVNILRGRIASRTCVICRNGGNFILNDGFKKQIRGAVKDTNFSAYYPDQPRW